MKKSQASSRRLRRFSCRRGSALYVTVLGTALIVSLLGLAGLTVARIERQTFAGSSALIDARVYARSAVELGLRNVNHDSNWRTTYTNGVETTPLSLGTDSSGTVSFILEDTDGNLTDADTDLRLHGVGRVGDVVQVSSIGIMMGGQALSCLEVGVCCNGPITFWSSSTISTNQTIHSNSSVDTNSGTTVNSDVEAVGSIGGFGIITGTTTTPVPARTVPTTSVFDYYITNGTAISFSAIPKIQGKRTITDVVLSPGNNPYGATDPAGIYVVDCAGAAIRVKYSRIIGTLVLVNPAATSIIEGEISWEPAVTNYPALLVQGGNMQFAAQDTPLDEAARGVNFNPAGSPYLGLTDDDQTDSYPSLIKGLVYVSNDLLIVTASHPHFDGAIIAGDELKVNSDESLTVTYDPLYLSDPPPGFLVPQLSVTPGSWRWDAAP